MNNIIHSSPLARLNTMCYEQMIANEAAIEDAGFRGTYGTDYKWILVDSFSVNSFSDFIYKRFDCAPHLVTAPLVAEIEAYDEKNYMDGSVLTCWETRTDHKKTSSAADLAKALEAQIALTLGLADVNDKPDSVISTSFDLVEITRLSAHAHIGLNNKQGESAIIRQPTSLSQDPEITDCGVCVAKAILDMQKAGGAYIMIGPEQHLYDAFETLGGWTNPYTPQKLAFANRKSEGGSVVERRKEVVWFQTEKFVWLQTEVSLPHFENRIDTTAMLAFSPPLFMLIQQSMLLAGIRKFHGHDHPTEDTIWRYEEPLILKADEARHIFEQSKHVRHVLGDGNMQRGSEICTAISHAIKARGQSAEQVR